MTRWKFRNRLKSSQGLRLRVLITRAAAFGHPLVLVLSANCRPNHAFSKADLCGANRILPRFMSYAMSVLLCGLAIIPPYQGAEHERIPMNNANGPTAKGFVLTGKLVFWGALRAMWLYFPVF